MTEEDLREIQRVRDECDRECDERVREWLGDRYIEPDKLDKDGIVILLVGLDGKPFRAK